MLPDPPDTCPDTDLVLVMDGESLGLQGAEASAFMYDVSLATGWATFPRHSLRFTFQGYPGELPGEIDLPAELVFIDYTRADAEETSFHVETRNSGSATSFHGEAEGTLILDVRGNGYEFHCGSFDITLTWTDADARPHVLEAAGTFTARVDVPV